MLNVLLISCHIDVIYTMMCQVAGKDVEWNGPQYLQWDTYPLNRWQAMTPCCWMSPIPSSCLPSPRLQWVSLPAPYNRIRIWTTECSTSTSLHAFSTCLSDKCNLDDIYLCETGLNVSSSSNILHTNYFRDIMAPETLRRVYDFNPDIEVTPKLGGLILWNMTSIICRPQHCQCCSDGLWLTLPGTSTCVCNNNTIYIHISYRRRMLGTFAW